MSYTLVLTQRAAKELAKLKKSGQKNLVSKVPRFRRLEICCGCRVLNAYFFLHPDFLADQNLYL